MSSAPETVDFAPRYSADQLQNAATRREAINSVGKVNRLTNPQEVDAALQRAFDAGLVRRDGNDPDDTFDGSKIAATVNNYTVERLVAEIKQQKVDTIHNQLATSWRAEMSRLPSAAGGTIPTDEGEAEHMLRQIVRQAVGSDQIQLSEYKPAVTGKAPKGGGAAPPTTPEQPARFIEDTRVQGAVREAMGDILNDLRATFPDIDDRFQNILNETSQRVQDIRRSETERIDRMRSQDEQERERLAEAARGRIQRQTLRTEMDNLSPADLARNNRQRREMLAFGTDRVDPETHQIVGDELPADVRKHIVDRAHNVAINEARAGRDEHVAAVDDVRERYQEMINATIDVNLRKQLERARDRAMGAEHQRQVEMTTQRAAQMTAAMDLSNAAFSNAQNRQFYMDRITADAPQAEEQVTMRRQHLGVEARPFVEVKNGGYFHWSRKNRGPRVIERYYRSPTQDNLVVLERRRRRSGDLVSQTVFTTERPIRRRLAHELPPREVRARVDQIRLQDADAMRADNSYRIRNAPADYIGGFGMRSEDIDNRYVREAPTIPNPINPVGPPIPDPRYTGRHTNTRGGIFYRWFRGRI